MSTFESLSEDKLFALFDSPLEAEANLHKFSPMTIDNNGTLRNNLTAAGFVNIFTDN